MTATQWIEKYNNAETHLEKLNVIKECYTANEDNVKDVIIPFHAELIKDKELLQKVLKTAYQH